MPITMVPYKDKGIYRLKDIDDTLHILEDHQVQLLSMKSTRCVALAKLTFVPIFSTILLSGLYIEFS